MASSQIDFRQLVELAEDAIYSAGLDGYFRYANPAALDMFGLEEDKVSGYHFLEMVRPDHRDRVDAFYRRQVEDEIESTYLEFPGVNVEGETIWLGQRVRLERVDGEVIGVVAVGRDISERRLAQVERQESIEKYRTLFDQSSDAVIVHDLSGEIVDVNNKAAELLGCEKADLLGRLVRSLHPEHAVADSDSAFKAVMQDDYTRFETTFLRTDGSEFPAEVSSSLIASGGETRILGVVRDVTEAKKAIDQIVEVTNLYEQILNAIPLQIALFDSRAAYEYVSPSGIADPEIRAWVRGKTNEEYCAHRGMDPAIGRQRSKRILDVIEKVERFELNESFPDRDGNVRHYIRYIDPIRDTAGTVVKALGWGVDVTDLKRVEEALKISEARKSAVLETALDCIISIDKSGRVLDFNPAAETTFGWTREEILGERMADFIIPEQYRQAHKDGMLRYQKTGEGPVLGQRIEISALRRSGEEFPIELAIQPIEQGGESVFTAYIRDISERKRSDEELAAANARAMESAEAKERFLANMSHEMRTPLNAVIGMTHLLQDTVLDSTQQRYVSTVQFASDNLLALISDLLDYAKVSAGKVVFEEISFSLDELLAGLENTFSFRAQEKGLSFRVRREASLPDRITGDPVRLSQILLNLISNAIKFTETGSVTVVVREDGKRGDNVVEVAFDVHDTGVGIEAEDLEDIFESFTQATAETTRKFGGTGLGLTIVKELVVRQGGLISVDSERGIGSTFSVCLPFEISADQHLSDDSPARMPTAEGLSGKRILVAEDNDINQFVVCSMLQRWGAETAVAHHGREAVEMVAAGTYDAVLMDIQMPEMDGHDATVAIRNELNVTPEQMPIIALTASTAPSERDRLIRAGMQDFILKPFEPVALYERLLHHLGITQPDVDHPDGEEEVHVVTDLFDLSRFEATTIGDPQLGVRLIDLYLKEAQENEAELVRMTEEADWDGVGRLTHRLKSSAGSLGLVYLQHLLVEIENGVRSSEPAVDATLISTVRMVMGQSTEFLVRLRTRLSNE